MTKWQLGPAHPAYHDQESSPPQRQAWQVGEQRPCSAEGCRRRFTVTALLPKQVYCSFGCLDRATGRVR